MKVSSSLSPKLGEFNIKLQDREITFRKAKFGVNVYESLANEKHAEVDRILAACKLELENVEEAVKANNIKMEEMNFKLKLYTPKWDDI
jgi:hypothetical protein